MTTDAIQVRDWNRDRAKPIGTGADGMGSGGLKSVIRLIKFMIQRKKMSCRTQQQQLNSLPKKSQLPENLKSHKIFLLSKGRRTQV